MGGERLVGNYEPGNWERPPFLFFAFHVDLNLRFPPPELRRARQSLMDVYVPPVFQVQGVRSMVYEYEAIFLLFR